LSFRVRLRDVLRVKESPHRIALAFSTGVFIGISPFLGLHTLLGVTVAWAFRLNTFAVITGLYITNPWTAVPIYTFSTWVGTQCLGIEQIIPKIDWSHITLSHLLNSIRLLVMPFLFGTLLVGTLTASMSYIIMYMASKKLNALPQ